MLDLRDVLQKKCLEQSGTPEEIFPLLSYLPQLSMREVAVNLVTHREGGVCEKGQTAAHHVLYELVAAPGHTHLSLPKPHSKSLHFKKFLYIIIQIKHPIRKFLIATDHSWIRHRYYLTSDSGFNNVSTSHLFLRYYQLISVVKNNNKFWNWRCHLRFKIYRNIHAERDRYICYLIYDDSKSFGRGCNE